jgi:predicted helicase
MSSEIQTYLDSVTLHLVAGNATEHTYRPALQHLLKALLPEYRVTNEPRQLACGSPDFEIAQREIPIGYIEAKTIGVDLDKVQESEQLVRYFKALDNVILTDYLEFRWYVKTDDKYLPKITVKLADADSTAKLKRYPERFADFENLLKNFIEAQAITLRSPEDLAEKMAYIATQMKASILEGYKNEDKFGKLHGQLDSFRSVLIDTLKKEEFADMLAQTVCYGLFAAKCSQIPHSPPLAKGESEIPHSPPLAKGENQHPPFLKGGQGGFSRLTAIFFVPKTNPLLRDLFNQLAGVDLDDGLVWLVEHLVKVLNHADIGAILADFGKRTRQEDPVVHFYETFLKHYNPQVREIRGVYYTPEPVVSYIVRSVDLLLKDKFKLKKGLADASKLEDGLHKVQILDPATGTGTFLYAVIAHIHQQMTQKIAGNWSHYVSEDLLPRIHGFELLMAAYTVAHMKLSLQLQDLGYDFKKKERLRIFLTNTLDKAHEMHEPQMAKFLSDEANAANTVKRDTPVMVILGNPPYSGHSANTGEWINDLLRGSDLTEAEKISKGKQSLQNTANYFQVDGESLNERNPKWINNDYVKFIRFSQWRINKTGQGILGFITDHGYLENLTFRGMRQALMQEFDEIYLVDLHGNSKKKEKHPDGSNDKNVFDIQQGVAIGIFVKYQKKDLPGFKNLSGLAKVYHAHLYGERKTKYQWLEENDIKNTEWTILKPQSPFYLFAPQNTNLLKEYLEYSKITEIMPMNSAGIVTARDNLTIHHTKESLITTVTDFITLDVEKARYKYDLRTDTRDWKVNLAQEDLKQHGLKVTPILYRPFDKRFTVYTGQVRGFICMPRQEVMQQMLLGENVGFITTRKTVDKWDFLATQNICGHKSCSAYDINSLFPLYIYLSTKNDLVSDSEKQEVVRKANFSESFIKDLESRLNLKFIIEDKGNFETTISALDIFHYMYAVFHSPTYREIYAEFLKLDFPRLPLTSDKSLFKQLVDLGGQLVQIHLMNADIENNCNFSIKGDNKVAKVEYKDHKVYINKTQYFDNVTPEVWEFHIGGYQVCQKWLKDRKDRKLSGEDLENYLYILAALEKTQALMAQIDETIPNFPII